MDAYPDPAPLAVAGRRGQRTYASPALLRFLASGSLLVGLVAAFFGVAYAINGATRAGAPVPVSVQIRVQARLQPQQATKAGSVAILHADGVTNGSWLQSGTGPVTLHADRSTAAEWLATRGGGAVVGVCMGLGAFLLRSLLLSVGRGQPFQRGNAARIAGIAGLTVVATIAAGVLPYVGARLVLDRLNLTGAGSPLTADLSISVVPLLLAVFLLAVAEAFRRGTELARDTEGLI